MQFDYYQSQAKTTAIYPVGAEVTYPLIGLIGEVGEFANKYKKTIRDNLPVDAEFMKYAQAELGDILWYLANIADDLGISLDEVAEDNLAKLFSRKQRGVLGGSGDER